MDWRMGFIIEYFFNYRRFVKLPAIVVDKVDQSKLHDN